MDNIFLREFLERIIKFYKQKFAVNCYEFN